MACRAFSSLSSSASRGETRLHACPKAGQCCSSTSTLCPYLVTMQTTRGGQGRIGMEDFWEWPWKRGIGFSSLLARKPRNCWPPCSPKLPVSVAGWMERCTCPWRLYLSILKTHQITDGGPMLPAPRDHRIILSVQRLLQVMLLPLRPGLLQLL